VCDSVCACVSNSESVCVCVHVLSIKHDLHIHYSQRVLCVVCMQARLSLCILELSFRSGMHVHSSLLRVCVRGCVRVRAVRTENACVCAHVSVFEYDQHDWKKSAGPCFARACS